MPRIPYGISEAELPSTGGVRGGTVGIPAAQEPGVDVATASSPGRALAGVGEQVAQAGQFVVQAEQYAIQRQRAQDVLDTKLAFAEDFMPRFQAKVADIEQGDYRTFREDLDKAGKQLIAEVAQTRKLSQQGQGLFRVEAAQEMAKAQQRLLGIETQRKQQDSLFVMSSSVQKAQQDYAQAGTDDERQLAFDTLHGTLARMVSTGLAHGNAAAKIEEDTKRVAKKDRALTAIQSNAMGSFNELQYISQAINEGRAVEVTTPAFRDIPRDLLPELVDYAARQMHQAATLRDQQERYTSTRVGQLQQALEGNLYHDTVTILPTPENVPLIQAQQVRINEAWQKQQLTKQGYESLISHNQAWLEKARTVPPRQDDPATEDKLTVQMLTATSHDEWMQVRQAIIDSTGKLKPETMRSMQATVEARENALHYSNRPSWRVGREMIMQSLFPAAAGLPGMGQFASNEERQRAMNALSVYDSRTSVLNPREVDEQAGTIARETIRDFVTSSSGQTIMRSYLPLPLQTQGTGPDGLAKGEQEAMMILQQLPIGDAERYRMFKLYRQWRYSEDGKLALGPLVVPLVPPMPTTQTPGATSTAPKPATTTSPAATTRYK